MRSGQACCHTSKITSSSGEAKIRGKLIEETEPYEGWLKTAFSNPRLCSLACELSPGTWVPWRRTESLYEPTLQVEVSNEGSGWRWRPGLAGVWLICVAGSSRIWLDHNRGTTGWKMYTRHIFRIHVVHSLILTLFCLHILILLLFDSTLSILFEIKMLQQQTSPSGGSIRNILFFGGRSSHYAPASSCRGSFTQSLSWKRRERSYYIFAGKKYKI